jgi:hypothetical protein
MAADREVLLSLERREALLFLLDITEGITSF